MSKREFPKEYLRDDLLISTPFWHEALASLSRPAALQLIPRLSPTHPCGIDPDEHGVKFGSRGDDTPIDTLLKSKLERPNMINLIRVGEFFEFGHGVDAVIAIEYTGLRQMGHGVPRAGTPIANLQPTADALTRAGYSVVVFEQMEVPGRKTKGRFISQILTPSSPVYTYGLLLDAGRDAAFPEVPPCFGLAQGLRGISLIEVMPDLEMVAITEGLTWEAARARLERFGSQAGKIYMHDSLGVASFLHQMVVAPDAQAKGQNISELLGKNFTSIEKVSGVRVADFAKTVENLVKRDLNLPAETPFKVVSRSGSENTGRPRPLYLGTATQIGLLPMRGVPDLVEQMLPKNSPLICRGLLKDLLLTPPPASVAQSIRSVISRLMDSDEALPDFRVSSPARYIRTIHAREASAGILRDLHTLSSDLLAADAGTLGAVMDDALAVASHVAGVSIGRQKVHAGASAACRLIAQFVSFGAEDPAYRPSHPALPSELFSSLERDFRGHLKPSADAGLAAAYRAVKEAAEAYERALVEDFALPPQTTKGEAGHRSESDGEVEDNSEAASDTNIDLDVEVKKSGKKRQPKKKASSLVYEYHDDALWLKDKSGSKPDEMIHPRDRAGKLRPDRHSTERVETALAEYKRAAIAAKVSVEQVLRRLSDELSPLAPELMLVVGYSNLMKTLTSHLVEVLPKGWTNNVEITDENLVEVDGIFPYWMHKKDAVLNSLSLGSMALLTGPNMAGKSTLLRSLCVTLLTGAAAGLLIPAARLKTRKIRSITARISSQDDSENAVSSFGQECLDVKAVLRDCQPVGEGEADHSHADDGLNWVAVDELGKGTDSRSGSALAGAVLETLYERGIAGMFATHWWELWDLPVRLSAIPAFHMEVADGASTHRVLAGAEFTSLAFDVAERLGLPAEVVSRAREISTHYHTLGTAGSARFSAEDVRSAQVSGTLLKTPAEASAGSSSESPGSEQPFSASSASSVSPSPSLAQAKSLLSKVSASTQEEIRSVPPSRTPPLKDMGKSCLYVLRTNLGYFYVGETDDIAGRLASHRKDKRKASSEAIYAVVAKGKSQARSLESELIAMLVAAHFPMLSSADQNHKHFGV